MQIGNDELQIMHNENFLHKTWVRLLSRFSFQLSQWFLLLVG